MNLHSYDKYVHVYAFFTVPTPSMAILPNDHVFGAIVGSLQDFLCVVSTAGGVELSSVMISWMRPGGKLITNDSRLIISPTMSSGSNYTSSLQFTYLTKEDEGVYMCKVEIIKTRKSIMFEIDNVIGKTKVHCHWLSVFIIM